MKKILSIILCISILFTTNVAALTKDETVYTKLDPSGKIKKTIVSNHLINNDLETIEDESILKNIVNVNGDEKFNYNNNLLTWSAKKKDIYYEGVTDKSLPIDINVKYYLNDKEININDLLNKKGHVKIVINYINKEEHYINGNRLYTPFVVTMATIIDNNINKNIEVANGKIVSNGTKDIVVALSSPGLNKSLNLDTLDLDNITLEFDTEKFSLPSIYNIATSNLLDENNLNIFNKLDDVYSKINLLESASNEIVNGANTLNNGMITYNNKFIEYKNGINTLTDGTNKLNSANKKINDGINLLNQKVQNISSISDKLNDLVEGVTNLNNGSNQLNTLATVKLSQAQNKITTMKSELETHLTNLYMLSSTTTDDNTKQALMTEISSLQEKLQALDLDSLNTDINTLKGGIANLNSGISELKTNVDNLPTIISPMLTELTTGVNTLTNGSNEFTTGINNLNSGMNNINSATTKLEEGSKELEEGSTKLKDGINKFNDEGIKQLTNYINTYVKNNVDKIETLKTLAQEYNNFSGKNKDTDSKVKFVMVIEN